MNSHNPQDFRYRPQRQPVEAQTHQQQYRLPSRTVTSQALFNGLYEIGIDHAGSLYRLKITRQGKLILNK